MRDTIIKELQKEYKQLLFLKNEIQDQLKNAPTGRMKTSKNRNQMLYYIKEGDKWKYLKKEDQEIARQIAMRDYNEAVLRKVLEQEKQVKQVLEKYDPRAIEKQYDSLSEGRKRLVKPWIEPEEMFVEKWLAKKYKGNDYWENTQEIYTQKGESMRFESAEKVLNTKEIDRIIQGVFPAMERS